MGWPLNRSTLLSVVRLDAYKKRYNNFQWTLVVDWPHIHLLSTALQQISYSPCSTFSRKSDKIPCIWFPKRRNTREIPWESKMHNLPVLLGARVGAVGGGTALQAGRSRVWFSMLSLEFFIDIILPAALWPWVSL